MDVYGDSGKMGRSESEILCPDVPTAARDDVSLCPGSGAAPESRDAVVLLGPDAPSAAATNGGVARPDALAATRNAVSYADWLTPQIGPGATTAATNGVACPDALVATLTTGVPPATRNAVSYTDRLTAQLSSGAAYPTPRDSAAYPGAVLMPQLSSGAASPTPRDGAAYPGAVLMPRLSSRAAAPTPRYGAAYPGAVLVPQLIPSAAAPTPRNAVAYPDVLVEHFGSTLPPATWNSVAYPGSGALEAAVNGVVFPGGRLSAVTTASENAVGYAIAVHDGGGYDERSGTALPFDAQAVDGTDRDVLLADGAVAQVEVPGTAAERAGGGLGRLGLAAAALAVAGLTAGGTATPATAVALFAMLVAGVTLVTVHVFRA